MIDTDPGRFPADLLQTWKSIREFEVLRLFSGNSSLLVTVVHAIAAEGAFDEQVHVDDTLTPYGIAEKISFNKLSENAWLVREYSAYEGALHRLYAELERQSPHLKTSLLRFVGEQYRRVKSGHLSSFQQSGDTSVAIVQQHSDEIFDAVYSNLVKVVQQSTSVLSREEISFGVLIVVVDAFIDCRVLEPPL